MSSIPHSFSFREVVATNESSFFRSPSRIGPGRPRGGREGLEQAWERHRENSKSLVSGLQELGLEMWVQNPSDRLPQLNMVRLPNGFDEATVRLHLLNDHDLEIGAGLGPLVGQVWRIGLMGYSSRPENVALCLSTLKRTLALLSHQSVSGES